MELRTQLQTVEAKLRDKRAELARARKIAEQAKAAYAEAPESEGALQAAQAAAEGVRTVQGEIERIGERHACDRRHDLRSCTPGEIRHGRASANRGQRQSRREVR
jgi:hypothetical protein